MAQSTKKAKMQALPALGDLLVEDDLDDTGTLASESSTGNSEADDLSLDDDPADDKIEKSVLRSDTAVAPPEVAARIPSPAPVVTGKCKKGRPPIQAQGTIHILNHSRTQYNYYREPKEENYISHHYSHPRRG